MIKVGTRHPPPWNHCRRRQDEGQRDLALRRLSILALTAGSIPPVCEICDTQSIATQQQHLLQTRSLLLLSYIPVLLRGFHEHLLTHTFASKTEASLPSSPITDLNDYCRLCI